MPLTRSRPVSVVLVVALVAAMLLVAVRADAQIGGMRLETAASGGAMTYSYKNEAGRWVTGHMNMKGARILAPGGTTAFTARGGTLLARGVRAGKVVRSLTGPVGTTLMVGELLWYGYRTAYPPPDWDWESGEDSLITAGTGEATLVELGRYTVPDYQPITVGITPEETATEIRARIDTGASFAAVKRSECLEPSETATVDASYDFVYTSPASSSLRTVHTVGTNDPTYGCSLEQGYDSVILQVFEEPNYVSGQADYTHRSFTHIGYGDLTSNRARVVAAYSCAADDGVGSTLDVVNESAWYDDHDDRPDLPMVSCSPGSHIVAPGYYVEYEDGTIRWIAGGPVADSQGTGDDFRDLLGNPATSFAVVPGVAPSYVEAPDDALWDECHEPASGVTCELILYSLAMGREYNPDLDHGWWYSPERDTEWECRLVHPTGGTLTLTLNECAGYQGEPVPADGTTEVETEDTTEAPPAPGEAPAPTLDPPTEDGQPPGSPEGESCMTRRAAGDGISSWLVFVGVACALEWAFVPSETATQFSNLRTEAESRPPFVATTSAIPFLVGAVDGWGNGTCPSVIANFTPDGFGLQGIGAEIPCDPQIPGLAVVRAMQLFAIVAAGGFAMWRIYSSTVEA